MKKISVLLLTIFISLLSTLSFAATDISGVYLNKEGKITIKSSGNDEYSITGEMSNNTQKIQWMDKKEINNGEFILNLGDKDKISRIITSNNKDFVSKNMKDNNFLKLLKDNYAEIDDVIYFDGVKDSVFKGMYVRESAKQLEHKKQQQEAQIEAHRKQAEELKKQQEAEVRWEETKVTIFKILFFLGIAITIAGIILSRKNQLVLFANYTDILYTFGIFLFPIIISIIVGIIINDFNPFITFISVFIILLAIVAIATYKYNIKKGILAFILAIISKLYMLFVFIFALAIAIFFAINRKQRWYETDTDHGLNQAGRTAAGVAGVSGVFLFLAKLGLACPGFVSFSEYIKGQQRIKFQENENNQIV